MNYCSANRIRDTLRPMTLRSLVLAAGTAWFINGDLCGYTNALGWRRTDGTVQAIEAFDCTATPAPTRTDSYIRPLPLYLGERQVGSLCAFAPSKQELEQIKCRKVPRR